MYNRALLFTLFFCLSYGAIIAQTIPGQELPYNPGRLDRAESLTKMDKAVSLTDAGKYGEAEGLFMEVLDEMEMLPADFCYHFGRNSYYQDKYSQSLSWLYKYLELKGSEGRYSEEAGAFIDKASAGLKKQKEGLTELSPREVLAGNNTGSAPPCEAGQQIKCPVCHGEGVVITPGYLESTYRTCPYGDDGAMDCETFILFREGKLTLPEE